MCLLRVGNFGIQQFSWFGKKWFRFENLGKSAAIEIISWCWGVPSTTLSGWDLLHLLCSLCWRSISFSSLYCNVILMVLWSSLYSPSNLLGASHMFPSSIWGVKRTGRGPLFVMELRKGLIPGGETCGRFVKGWSSGRCKLLSLSYHMLSRLCYVQFMHLELLKEQREGVEVRRFWGRSGTTRPRPNSLFSATDCNEGAHLRYLRRWDCVILDVAFFAITWLETFTLDVPLDAHSSCLLSIPGRSVVDVCWLKNLLPWFPCSHLEGFMLVCILNNY